MHKSNLNLSFFDKKNILITGAGGYIGSSVANVLTKTSCKLKLLTSKNGNIRDIRMWKRMLKNTHILFHFAAQTSAKFANENPHEDLQLNVIPILHILKTCKDYRFSPIIIFSGTATEFGATKKGLISEDHIDSPITIYDIHKLTAEKYLQYYSSQLHGRSVTLRLPNIYGPGQRSSKPDRGIVNLMVKKALEGETLTIFGTGKYVRDYLFIDDAVRAFLLSCSQIHKTSSKYYVIGTGVGHTIRKMISLIQKKVSSHTHKNVNVTSVPFPSYTSAIEYRHYIANSSRFNKDTGWSATISLAQGIEKTIEYYL